MIYFHKCRCLVSQTLKNHYHPHESHISCRLLLAFSSSFTGKRTNETSPIFDLLIKHNFSSQIASKVSSELSYLKDTERCDSAMSFFKETGFSNAHLEKIINRKPRLLASNVDRTLKPKIQIFRDFGFSPADIVDIFSADPWIFLRSADNSVEPSVRLLRELLGSNSEVAKLLKVSGGFLKVNLEKTMLPNIELLKSCGISEDRIVRHIYCFPRFCLHKPENMKKFIHMVDELGCDRKSKMYLHAIRTVASRSEKDLKLKLELFQELGFSEKEILSMFQRKPQIFAISIRKIKNTVQVILDSGKYELSNVFDNPDVFICSVEKTLKPRLQIIDILESRNLIKKRPSLSTIFKSPVQKFFRKYVCPYLHEVSELTMEGAWTNETCNSEDKDPGKQSENFVL